MILEVLSPSECKAFNGVNLDSLVNFLCDIPPVEKFSWWYPDADIYRTVPLLKVDEELSFWPKKFEKF